MVVRPRILLVTACGASKHQEPKPAYQLYKSSRIRAVYNRRMGCDMAVFSTKYGLVEAEEIIEPYEAVLTKQKAKKLIPQMAQKIKDYDCVVYFKGGAGTEFYECIREACNSAGKAFVAFGYRTMGDVNEIANVVQLVEKGQLQETTALVSVA